MIKSFSEEHEIRLRCLEVAIKTPQSGPDGYLAFILAAAKAYEDYVVYGMRKDPLIAAVEEALANPPSDTPKKKAKDLF